ncbi:protein inturned-like [Styela clava]
MWRSNVNESTENISDFDDSDTYSSSGADEFSDDSNPPWHDEIDDDGELFFVEDETSVHQTVQQNRDARNKKFDNTLSSTDLHGTASNAPSHRQTHSISVNERKTIRDEYLAHRNQQQNRHRQHDSFRLHSDESDNEFKTVFVCVNSASSYGSGDSSLLKQMLGIISLNSLNGGQYFAKTSDDKSIIISALLPDGPAFRSEAIEIGDILLAINDVAVYRSNIEQVLRRIPQRMELKLTIQCEKINLTTPEFGLALDSNNLLSDSEPKCVPVSVQHLKPSVTNDTDLQIGPHNAVFYLTLNVDSDTAKGEEDILYSFPTIDNSSTRKLKSIRGIFTTLADVTTDAFRSEILSSTMFVNDELVHCAYCHHNLEVLIICVPASKCSLNDLHKTMSKMVRLFKIMFGTLSSGFQEKNHSRLNHLFYLLFTTNAWLSNSQDTISRQFVDGIRSLSLHDETIIEVDNALTEFEAADFDDGYHSRGLARRQFSILGSCLFYKGYLISNHLPNDHLNDVNIYCQSYCLLGKLCVGQLLIWREIHPMHSGKTPNTGDYKEISGKYFYLIVGIRNSLLCILLESGGCTLSSDGKSGPPPLYVNHARAAILHLENIKIPQRIDEHLFSKSIPEISSADSMKKKSGSSLFGTSVHNKPPTGSGVTSSSVVSTNQGSIKFPFSSPKKSTADGSSPLGKTAQGSPKLFNRLGSQKSTGSQGSIENTESPVKGVKSLTSAFSTGNLRDNLPLISSGAKKPTEKPIRLVAGVNNTLFHFVNLDVGSGTILSSSDQALSNFNGPFHKIVLENFENAMSMLHERLSSRYRKNANQNSYEEGTLFHCQMPDINPEGSKKSLSFVQYWVIGRLMTKPKLREFYVCYHDSIKQNTKEMVFRLGFGIAA